MFSLSSLFCWVPRRRKGRDREAPPAGTAVNGKRRGRRRRHIHAKAGSLAPIRTGSVDLTPDRQGISPLSTRTSIAFSEGDYHDAVEEFPDSLSGRASIDGSYVSSPRSGSHDGGYGLQQQQQTGLASRLHSWWEGRRHTTTTHTATEEVAVGATLTPRPASPHLTAPEGLIEQSPPDAAKMGCISIFTAAQATVAHRKFLRLGKPPAGSSFRSVSVTRVGEEESGVEVPAAPPQPPPVPRLSVVDKLLAKLSPGVEPGTPAPLFLRLLSGPRKHMRKTSEEEEAQTAAAWEPADATTFAVRSHNYMRSKLKEPSGPSIYRLLGVDVYSFDFKLFHIAQHIQLPEAPQLGPEAEALPPDQQLPPLLIINLQMPWYAPSLFGANDGVGYSLVYYFGLPEGWEPSQVSNTAALGLVQRFMNNKREFDGSPTRDRFKLIPQILNIDEWAEKGPLSGYEHKLLTNYHDKPLLTRPQQRYYRGQNYLEIDLDIHNYAFIARKAFHGFIHRLAPVVFENAFVVQGNRQEELPEQILAAARVYRVDFDKARPFPAKSVGELGNGTGPAHEGEAHR